MAKILMSDLQKANDSKELKLLIENVDILNNLSKAIQTAIEKSNETLAGPAYDAAREKLLIYSNQILKLSATCAALTNGIISANGDMFEYIEGYLGLDDEKLEFIFEEIKNIEAQIFSLKSGLFRPKKGEENYQQKMNNYYYTQECIAELEYELESLKKLYDKLSGLAAADSSAYSKILEGDSNLENILSPINEINVA